jgi:hypothetical protein
MQPARAGRERAIPRLALAQRLFRLVTFGELLVRAGAERLGVRARPLRQVVRLRSSACAARPPRAAGSRTGCVGARRGTASAKTAAARRGSSPDRRDARWLRPKIRRPSPCTSDSAARLDGLMARECTASASGVRSAPTDNARSCSAFAAGGNQCVSATPSSSSTTITPTAAPNAHVHQHAGFATGRYAPSTAPSPPAGGAVRRASISACARGAPSHTGDGSRRSAARQQAAGDEHRQHDRVRVRDPECRRGSRNQQSLAAPAGDVAAAAGQNPLYQPAATIAGYGVGNRKCGAARVRGHASSETRTG